MGYREAIAAAFRAEDQVDDWADPSAPPCSRFVYSLEVAVNASPEQAFAPIRGIGGSTGWYYANWLWRLRDVADIWMGGLGFNPGRRHPDQLEAGDIVDCWQVEACEANHRLLLAARMKLPGRAYWYASYPVHPILFPGMLKHIGRVAQGSATEPRP